MHAYRRGGALPQSFTLNSASLCVSSYRLFPTLEFRAGEGGSIPCYLWPTSSSWISGDASRLTHNDRVYITSSTQPVTLQWWNEPLNKNKLIFLLCSHLLLRIRLPWNPIPTFSPSIVLFSFAFLISSPILIRY